MPAALPSRQRRRILARGGAERDRQRRARVRRSHRVAIHRRARERRQVERGADQLGEHAADDRRTRARGARTAAARTPRAAARRPRRPAGAEPATTLSSRSSLPVVVAGRCPSSPVVARAVRRGPVGVVSGAGRRRGGRRRRRRGADDPFWRDRARPARVDRGVGVQLGRVQRHREVGRRDVRERDRHVVVPDLRGQRRAGDDALALDVLHRDAALGVADPDAGREIGGVAAEPGVRVVARRPRLAGLGTPIREVRARARARRHVLLEDAGHHRGDAVGDGAAMLGRGERADEIAVAVAHTPDGARGAVDAARGERRVHARQLERRDLERAEGDRGHRLELGDDAEACGPSRPRASG